MAGIFGTVKPPAEPGAVLEHRAHQREEDMIPHAVGLVSDDLLSQELDHGEQGGSQRWSSIVHLG
jgi:hypothetical protein